MLSDMSENNGKSVGTPEYMRFNNLRHESVRYCETRHLCI